MVCFNGGMLNAGSRLTGGFHGGSRIIQAPGRLLHFAIIGTACTVAFSLVYVLLRRVAGPIEANIAALSLTMTVNFLANRRFTFRATDGPLGSQVAGYLVVMCLASGCHAWCCTLRWPWRIRRPPWLRPASRLARASPRPSYALSCCPHGYFAPRRLCPANPRVVSMPLEHGSLVWLRTST